MPSLLPRAAALLLALLLALPGAAGAKADLQALRQTAERLTAEAADLQTAIGRQAEENARLLADLETFGRADVTFEDLRQAQFEVDIARTRLLTLQHRLAEQAARVEEANAAVVAGNAALGASTPDTLDRVVDEAALELLARSRAAASAVLGSLTQYETLSADYLNLRQEQLTILQRAIRLDAITKTTADADAALLERLRTVVDDLAQSALALSNDAATVQGSAPEDVARRNLLRLRSDEALLRSSSRVTDMEIVETRNLLAGTEPLLTEPSVPTRLLGSAIDALADREVVLAQRLGTTAANRDALADLGRIVADADDPAARALSARIDNLRTLLDTQEGDLRALRDRIATTTAALAAERVERRRNGLLVRETARTDRAARERVRAELAEVPAELRAIYGARLAEVRGAVEVAAPRRFAIFGAAVLALLAITLWLRERVLKAFVAAEATRATAIPLEVLRRNLFWLLPVGVWWLFIEVFAVSRDTAFAIGFLLAIPAAAALVRDLTQVIVTRRSREGGQQRIGVLLTRAMEVAVTLVALVVFVYTVLGEVAFLPSTQSAINRLAYSVFVLAGLPMLGFVAFFAAARDGSRGPRNIIAAGLAVLPPAALIATGIAGLAGYTRLAEVMFVNLSIAIGIAAGFALVLGILHDLVAGVAAQMRATDPARAYFVRRNFLDPLLRTAQVVLALVTATVAADVFDWTAQTPILREALLVWNTTLFTVGATPYSVGSVLVAAFAFAFVFWLAAWSRRVAYTVVFRRLKDIGIRQSLSVFTQYVIIVVGVLLTLSAVGFDVTTLTVFAASLGVGIGFGLQNVINNFVSGLLILVERPLRLGDIVTVGGNSGVVSQIGIRSMRLKTFDEFDLIVPNSSIISDTFTNWTRSSSLMRALLSVGIGYGDDPQQACAIVLDILKAHPGVVPAPAPQATADDFGDSAVKIRVCWYVDLRGGHDGFVTRSDIITAIMRRFAEAGITIPFPQRDLHMIPPPVPAPRPAPRPEPAEDRALEPAHAREAF